MKDPKVEKLVDDFYSKVDQLNTVWKDLNAEGVYISTKVDGDHTIGSLKQLKVDRIEQNVSYLRPQAKV